MADVVYKAKASASCKEQAFIDTLNGSSLPNRFTPPKFFKKKAFIATNFPNIALWLDPKQGIAVPIDGTPVSQWADASGLGRNAVQNTSSRKPTFKTDILNGRPAIRFDGVDDYMTLWTPAASNYTVYMVMIPRVIRTGYQLSGLQSNGAYLYQGIYRDLSNNQFSYSYFGDGTELKAPYTFVVGTPYLRTMVGVRNGNAYSFINKVQIASAAATFNGAPSAPYLLGVNNLMSAYCQWDILELAIYSVAHTTIIQSQIETALTGKYGISA